MGHMKLFPCLHRWTNQPFWSRSFKAGIDLPSTQTNTGSLADIRFRLHCMHFYIMTIQRRLIEGSKWEWDFAQYSLKPHIYGELFSINIACGGIAVLHVQYTRTCTHKG